MYRFQIIAPTQMGESIGLVGSVPELGSWDATKAVRLWTHRDRYPLWWAEIEIDPALALAAATAQGGVARIEYKYVRLGADGKMSWEKLGPNRWLPIETEQPPSTVIVDDGAFGYVQPWPYGYLERPVARPIVRRGPQGRKVVVIGSSVALGCSAWMLRGWVWRLEQALQEYYGHVVVNVSELGANVSTTIDRFPLVVAPEQPDIVVIALSLGNEGLAYCAPHERRAVQRRFESGLLQLVNMTRALGARPILAGLYPNGNYDSEHYWLLRDTHTRMQRWGVPLLDWLDVLEDGRGRWQAGISFDPAHPNTEGHRRMFEAIDLSYFQINPAEPTVAPPPDHPKVEIPIYRDNWGFHIFFNPDEKSLRLINTTPHPYTINPGWQEVQTVLQRRAGLLPGIYLAHQLQEGASNSFVVRGDGRIETPVEIPSGADLEYEATFKLFAPGQSQILFYDGHLGLLKASDRQLQVVNESDHEYNIQPMWQEVRTALKAMPPGVYEDSQYPDAPFRTMMIGPEGLESRVKAPPRSAVLFEYRCPLSEISRVAIIPLGDRCAARMLLYKLQYDGPAYPFDLTRTTNLGDVADIIANDFSDMWNPGWLHYNPVENRIYHGKWSGLSFAHEVEDTDDPVNNMFPVYERMRVRYSSRAERFRYTLNHCDKALFIRTGGTHRGYVVDLMSKLAAKMQDKPFRLLLISPQPSEEFADLPNVIHYDLEFNPDRMQADLGYWMHATEMMHGILDSLGVSSKNLFWCPPKPPRQAVKVSA